MAIVGGDNKSFFAAKETAFQNVTFKKSACSMKNGCPDGRLFLSFILFCKKVGIGLHLAEEIMSDLHEFPFFEEILDETALQSKMKKLLKLDIAVNDILKEVTHSFTRYRVKLYPFLCHTKKMSKVEGYTWMTRQELERFAFSSGHRRIWSQVKI